MTIEQLRAFHRAAPFQPFEMHLADGRMIDVNHPELLAINPPGRTIGVGVGQVIEIVDLLLVKSLKPKGKSKSQSNGT